ncbi:hypothetical protein [Fructilactobacillus cliffordii]|uniref:Uncharacterized protein n=1 Tax=Fructilactobacillus cliffordii TaxID=2940299 RepID=A0A9Q9E3G4_9LACO|nr:hypothetical protein [Fructilactobacillus cliffordii]USS86434.1 hypothetical protein M3M38_07140 [Fructilactobacillus cliffordii]USS89498.1 hypothetical protein M3M40_01540 [Fructilactobacillus cliffordii]
MNEQQQDRLKQAQSDLEVGQIAQATAVLLDLYDESDDDAILAPLAQSLMRQHQITAANRLVDEHFSYFVREELPLLFEVLLADHRFIEAHIILAQLPLAVTDSERFQLQQAEHSAPNNEGLVRQFNHLGAFSVVEQQQISSQAERLPKDQYVIATRKNLVDADVHPVWRLQLLNNLMRLRMSDNVSFLWIDNHEYSVVPERLVDSTESQAFHQLLDLLEKRYGHTDPIKQGQLQALIQVELQNLYPFVDDIVDNPEQWLVQFERQAQGKKLESDGASAEKWLKTVDQLMTNLID